MARWDITEIIIMKKTTLLLAIALFAVTFTSCQKTKPYNPKEKISKIYVDLGLGKNLSEAWTWEGKQLKSIDYYDVKGTLDGTIVFTYNKKNQVQKVDNADANVYTEYFYDDHDRLYLARCVKDGDVAITYSFEYDDDYELSEMVIDVDVTELFAPSSKSLVEPLRYVLPELTFVATNDVLNNAERGGIRCELDFEWIGKNISEIELDYGAFSGTYYFKYDDKLNPFRNFYDLAPEDIDFKGKNNLNKNNIVSITEVKDNIFGDSKTEYIYYTYDGKFPVAKSYGNVIEYYEYE